VAGIRRCDGKSAVEANSPGLRGQEAGRADWPSDRLGAKRLAAGRLAPGKTSARKDWARGTDLRNQLAFSATGCLFLIRATICLEGRGKIGPANFCHHLRLPLDVNVT
jgi:hypothetical protein